MAKSAKLKSIVERRGRPRKRAEQQRSLETRGAILDAAIAEFAERGFEGASIRADQGRVGYLGARKLRFATTRSIAGGIRHALPLHRRISRISPVHAAGSFYQQSAAEVGCGNGIGAAPGTID